MEQQHWRGRRSYCLGPSHRTLAREVPHGNQRCSRAPQTTRGWLCSNPFLSLHRFAERPSPALWELTRSGAHLQVLHTVFSPRTLSGAGSTRVTGQHMQNEWGKNHRFCLNCLALRTLSWVLLLINCFSGGLCDLHNHPLGMMFPMS